MVMEWKKKFFVFCLIFVISDIRCSEQNTDKYITSSKAECFSSKRLFSCIKYKAARFIWSVAVGRIQFNLLNDERFNLVKIANDSDDNEFWEYRHDQDVSETSKILSFLKRSVHTFLAAHGFQISFDNDIGARLLPDAHSHHSTGKKKRKLKLIVPLLILLKVAAILVGIGGIQLLLVGGGLFFYQYVRNCAQNTVEKTTPSNPQCKSQEVTMRTSIIDQEPESPFANYEYRYISPPSYHSSASSAKDWANNRAYSAYEMDAVLSHSQL
ncbi:uncharacterized protein LOC119075581 [Bradysia coprophila]|uniref:uncharacterized protein LOC119075581 n=1 Tax=Bradysia coprophila TaxID=38358 RepID=UPI00187D71F3|nr:uncharacterized protein LOC119075581 [Bradysia coprophila]